jgi:hypothetical protein
MVAEGGIDLVRIYQLHGPINNYSDTWRVCKWHT